MVRHLVLLAVCSCLYSFVAAGCAPKENSVTLARVGKTVLTLNDVMASLPPEYRANVSRDQIISYVKEWVDAEILYQEALRRKIDRQPEVVRHLHAIKRDYLCAEQIHRSTFDKNNPGISDSLVSAYYLAHGSALLRDKDVIKFADIVLDDANTAALVRNVVTCATFADVGQRYSKEPFGDSLRIPYLSLDKIPACLGSVIFGIRINGISAPIPCEGRFHIVLVLDKQSKGSPASLAEVRPQIVEVLAGQHQKIAQEQLIRTVRASMDVALFLEQIPQIPSTPQPDSGAAARSEIPGGALP